jgi:hypothetical protein
VLQRSRTRESSILTVASIATSASLVLLGLFIQTQVSSLGTKDANDDNLLMKYKYWVQGLGMLFAGLGVLYREITARSIHRNDTHWLDAYVHEWMTNHLDALGHRLINKKGIHSTHTIENPICYCRMHTRREVLVRALLVIPIIAWSVTSLLNVNPNELFGLDIAFASVGLFFSGLIIGLGLCTKD